jgi:hypothetical protein
LFESLAACLFSLRRFREHVKLDFIELDLISEKVCCPAEDRLHVWHLKMFFPIFFGFPVLVENKQPLLPTTASTAAGIWLKGLIIS